MILKHKDEQVGNIIKQQYGFIVNKTKYITRNDTGNGNQVKYKLKPKTK